MSTQRSRIALLTGLATVMITGPGAFTAWAEAPPAATVYKGAT